MNGFEIAAIFVGAAFFLLALGALIVAIAMVTDEDLEYHEPGGRR